MLVGSRIERAFILQRCRLLCPSRRELAIAPMGEKVGRKAVGVGSRGARGRRALETGGGSPEQGGLPVGFEGAWSRPCQ
jgi:hypothetical protein